LQIITPVGGSNLLEEKGSRFSELSSDSNSEELFQSKTSNPGKWTQLISADFSFKFSAFYYQPRGLFLARTFFEKNRSDIWGIYESTPQPQGMHTVNRISRDLRFLRFEISQDKFENATGSNKLLHQLLYLPAETY